MKKALFASSSLIAALSLFALPLIQSCSKGSIFAVDSMAKGMYPEPSGQEGNDFNEIQENDFILTSEQPVSTFSVDADGAAYSYMRRTVKEGDIPMKNSVRIEEYLNYFTFNYSDPTGNESVAINAEVSPCPWNTTHNLIRLGLKGKSLPESKIPAANFIFLVDVSGSMRGADRLELVKKGLLNLVDNMRQGDRIAIITYSGKVAKILPSTDVSDSKKIKKAIRDLTPGGSTAGGAAMEMAYKEAMDNFMPDGNNRIIMCTDGDFNVGVSDTDALVGMVEQYLDKGIYLSIMGFGFGNLYDSRMESLSNHGNGTYNYIDCEAEMQKVFVNERSHFYSVATDTKCQIEFNPEAVKRYRLIGYENRVMKNEDFEDDSKDAGEIGAGQTITALYEIEMGSVETQSSAPLATFSVRYKKTVKDESRPLELGIKVNDIKSSPSDEFSFAAGTAAFGLCLRDSKYKGNASYEMAEELLSKGLKFDSGSYRSEFVDLVKKTSQLAAHKQ